MQDAREKVFQQDIIDALVGTGKEIASRNAVAWKLGESAAYDQKHALYTEDLVGYLSTTQPEQWNKFSKMHPKGAEEALVKSVARQLDKKGTLHVLRNTIKDRGAKFRLCQFKPDHDLNPETMERYAANRLRVVPELNYSPNDYTGRLDLALFVNGIPVATLELKSEFKQSVERAVRQYKVDRKPKSANGKPEPLLMFKRGALVHFAVSQFEARMTTKLNGASTYFLPFNKGTRDGGAGNDMPKTGGYATKYLWEEVFAPFNERNMNPGLKGRDMRKAFDTEEYQVMLVANKFQTGFDQPKTGARCSNSPLPSGNGSIPCKGSADHAKARCGRA